MNGSATRLAALALPLVSLAAIWGWSDYQSRQGTDWEVPVEGYDPRDLLRGHYVRFNYDWPVDERGEEEQDIFPDRWLYDFCVEGEAPVVTRIVPANGGPDGCDNYVRDGELTSSGRDTLRQGRIYIPQDEGPKLEAKLRDPGLQGIVRFRLRDDGHLTPLELKFRPRPPAENDSNEESERAADDAAPASFDPEG